MDQLPLERFQYMVELVTRCHLPLTSCLDHGLRKPFKQPWINHKDCWESEFVCCNRCIWTHVPIILDSRFINRRDSIRRQIMDALRPPIHRFPNGHELVLRQQFVLSATNLLTTLSNLILPLSKLVAEYVFDPGHWNMIDERLGFQVLVRDFVSHQLKWPIIVLDIFPWTTGRELLIMFIQKIQLPDIPVSSLRIQHSPYIGDLDRPLSEYEIHPNSCLTVVLSY